MPAVYVYQPSNKTSKINLKKKKREGEEINSAGKTAQTAKCSPLGNEYNQLKRKKRGDGEIR